MPVYYHVTLKGNVDNIERHGLLPSYSMRRSKNTWLVDSRMITWAMHHIQERHNVGRDELAVFMVQLEASNIRRGGVVGTYVCYDKIPPEFIKGKFTCQDTLVRIL